MDKRELLRAVAEKEYYTLADLVTEAARILPHIAQEQRRYRVTVYPDERTIRYYINEGLVDRPSLSKEKPSRFTYRHLLQILAIKHLQAQYLPLNKIKGMLAGLNEEQMEDIIARKEEVLEDYCEDSCISSPMRRLKSMVLMDMAGPSFVPKRGIHESKISYENKDSIEEWLRISVTNDIDLNIRTGSVPKSPEKRKEFVERLAAKLRIYLEQEKKQGGL